MNKDLRDLIEEAEEEEKNRAQLEKTIEKLKNEINRLNLKLKEEKFEKEPSIRIPPVNVNLSEEINNLKEVIDAQKQKLSHKESEVEELRKKIEQNNLKIIEQKKKLEESEKSKVAQTTKNALNRLMEDYARLERINEELKNQVKDLEIEKELLADKINELKTEQSVMSKSESELSGLKQKIQLLETERTTLINNINNLKNKVLKESELEQIVETLKSKNVELEEQTTELNQTIEKLKRGKLTIKKLEGTVSELKDKIRKLEDENLRFKGKEIEIQEERKDEIGPVYELKSPLEQNKIIEKIKSSIPPLKREEITTSKPKDLVLLKKDKDFKNNIEIKSSTDSFSFQTEGALYTDESTERKKKCPKCGNTNSTQIREMDDKTNVISAQYKIYGKKYRCGQCGTEWR